MGHETGGVEIVCLKCDRKEAEGGRVHTVLGQLYKLKALNAEATTGILLEIRILSKAAKNDNVQSLSFPTLLKTRRLCLFSRHHRKLTWR
jgi:hypothetical protein